MREERKNERTKEINEKLTGIVLVRIVDSTGHGVDVHRPVFLREDRLCLGVLTVPEQDSFFFKNLQ